MSTRFKSAVLILVTLLIGGIIGALIHAQITERRFDRLDTLRSNRGFVRMIERAVEFESPEQREQVLDIADATAVRLFETMQRTRRETKAILDSTRQQFSEILSEEQMARLEKRLLRRPDRMRRRRPGRRPPPPPPDRQP
jgi:hypothetical protein